MNKEKRRVPKLRFPGFTEDWEQRKLGDIATFSKGNGYSKSDLTPSGDPIILYGRLYTNYETTISNVDTFVELKDKSVISQGGEVIVPASGETAEDISRASVVKNQGIIIGGDLNVIKVNHLLDPTFLALTISNGEQQKELSKRAQGKSVVHLHNSDLQEVNLTFPLLNEQKEISTLFEKMDNIITLHQRKLKHLNFKKKALLQKLFPKNGERHPELRFPEFTDAWEQRKLGECVDISTGYPFDSQDFNENGEYLVITNSNIQENTPFVLNNIGNRIDLDDSLKKYILDIDDLLITMDGTVGRVAIVVDTKLVLAQRVCRIKSNEPYYIYQLLSKNNFIQSMNKISHGGTIKHISLSEISEYQAFYPKSQKERIKISSVLTNYDKRITLHQRKLEHLQLQKKALLQQMFV